MIRPGWLKLYNRTLDSEFWTSSDEPFDWRSAFIHVLLSANWRQGISRKNGHMITIERGQWLTSIRSLMATFRWSRKRVENWLEGMDTYGMLTHKSVGFGTVLTVVNYDKFQSDGATVEHTEEHTVEHTAEHKTGHTDSHTVEHTEEHMTDPRSKTTDYRQQTTDSKSPADAGTPPADNEPPIGSPEWYKLHYDDDWGDEE